LRRRAAPRVTLDDIKANIATEATFTAGAACDALGIPAHDAAKLLTICILTTKNGYTVLGQSAPPALKTSMPKRGAPSLTRMPYTNSGP
jgi:hypothetical protein